MEVRSPVSLVRNHVSVILPRTDVNSGWSKRDNDVRLRFAVEAEVTRFWPERWPSGELRQTTEPDERNFKSGRFRINFNPLAPFGSSHAVYQLGAPQIDLGNFSGIVRGIWDVWSKVQDPPFTLVNNRDEAIEAGFRNENAMWVSGENQCWLDVKWGQDSPRFKPDVGGKFVIQIFRRKGNHIDPWRAQMIAHPTDGLG